MSLPNPGDSTPPGPVRRVTPAPRRCHGLHRLVGAGVLSLLLTRSTWADPNIWPYDTPAPASQQTLLNLAQNTDPHASPLGNFLGLLIRSITGWANNTSLTTWAPLPILEADIGPWLQTAYNANVGCIYIPAGNYNWLTPVTFSAQPPCFQGAGWTENVQLAPPGLGTWIHITNTSLLPATITGMTGQGGTGEISNIAFYEDQPASSGGWTPNAYQYIFTVTNNGGRLDFSNLMFFNTTHCISEYRSARFHIEKIYGQPVGTCLTFDDETDVFTVRDIDFWPFWINDNNIFAYTQASVDPIVYNRADSPYGDNIFVLGYHSGLAFAQTASGVTTGAQFGSIQIDASKYPIWIESGTSNVQFQVANFRGSGGTVSGSPVALTGSECYRDEGSGTVVSVANFQCFLSGSNGIHLTSSGNLQYNNALLWAFNYDNNGSVGINAGASGYIFGSNQPSIVNPQNSATVIPQSGTKGQYAIRGVRQFWTPILTGTTTTGTYTASYSVGTFWYDGSQMRLAFDISATSVTGFVGALAIQGLPVAPNGATNQNTSCVISRSAGFTLDSGYTVIGAENVPASPAQFLMLESGGAVNTQPLPISTLGSSIALQGECTVAYGQ